MWQGMAGEKTRRESSSSLIDFVYPKGMPELTETSQAVELSLPLKVGIAFVPSRHTHNIALTEAEKSKMLKMISQKLSERHYIAEITVIPDTYLRGGRGFVHLQQLARLYDIEVIGLASYDQVISGYDNRNALWYWTGVGALAAEGSTFEVNTFLDFAVFDVPSKKLLMRAPGIHQAIKKTNLISSHQKLREIRRDSLTQAHRQLVDNVDHGLTALEERLKKPQNKVRIRHKPGYHGGGTTKILLFALAVFLICRSRKLT